MKRFNEHRPELTTISVDPSMNTNDYSAKSLKTWTVKELLHYLTINADSKNTFELKSIVGYLAKKAQINEGPRYDACFCIGFEYSKMSICDG